MQARKVWAAIPDGPSSSGRLFSIYPIVIFIYPQYDLVRVMQVVSFF